MRRNRLGLAACAACLALAMGTAARADLLVTVTPTVTPLNGPNYLYSYVLAVLSSSTVGLAEFDLNVRPGVQIGSIVAPTGFVTLYTSGDPDIQFLSSDPSTDVAPGKSATFSFRADAGPASNSLLARGFDATGGTLQFQGATLTPSAVPEPSVLVLSALGGLAVLGRTAFRKSRGLRPL